MSDAPRETVDGTWRRGFLRAGPAGGAIVLKFGGSLLGRADWPDLLASLAREHPGIPMAVVVGGGATVDSIRRIDAALGLDPAVSHGLAIEAMGVTARLVRGRTGWPLSIDLPRTASPCVVDVPSWLAANGRLARLPVGWHVTSDSIAAFIATETGSDLLVAKSVPPTAAAPKGFLPHHAGPSLAVNGWMEGWVDEWFPVAAADITRIEWTAPISPTTSPRPAGRPTPPAAASPRRDSRPCSPRPPTAG